ncbi:hypothetical protein GLYMA_08G291400v4 [Glycine max]|nr:hypothetical protein GLYMA_08G291400v4 [Glycine max]KAH1053659.1 hypothetical protein GYH30_022766 [Glycine max]
MCAMMEGLLMVAIAMTIILDLVLTGVAEHDVRCRSGDLVCGEEDDERDPRSCAVTGECDGGSGRGCGRCGVEEKKKKDLTQLRILPWSYFTFEIG